ncbi:MAG: Glycine/sarcosine/dimethylglycine N-methyltransferase [Alphaproteobacteria bacterium MarineAlpha5_Bin8]|nr:MAG: Glycine/sarcosine/dimethylglycine N-methyltransferase [Alphaproteobacteria bacterium MarineAlpha5_Bin7]PPR48249.1 MAG: Glycine/sarcosine/dimethylglycine N-methyltransferase [Alphaproteobacteria bacterium MarineAlpha5_Bin8]PPR54447.1 MAG: Glycine/sarcosine/dimethylglycine N-methyltransferase [Alphaproteobacteria bacterium MarineAlpha5_Bin6]|tara:strand:+ start:491 stop:1321 length:831 start_codon:yes stop_codon:yes gene_type:complete
MKNDENIKSMKLYNDVDRVYNELKEIGKNDSDSLQVNELTSFDQLHYHGTYALDYAIKKIGINSNMLILEIGSGIGGPARYIANKTGASVVALELQSDQHKVAMDLTERCGLAKKVEHICGDFITYNWQGKKFDAIVSWLTLYHIVEHNVLLKNCFNYLKSGGFFYAEDLFSRKQFSEEELYEISKEMYGNYLPDLETYKSEIERSGLKLIDYQDMSEIWAKFTHERNLSYISKKDRHLRVHGKKIYENMNMFYAFMDRCFSQGKLGGIRITAKKS